MAASILSCLSRFLLIRHGADDGGAERVRPLTKEGADSASSGVHQDSVAALNLRDQDE